MMARYKVMNFQHRQTKLLRSTLYSQIQSGVGNLDVKNLCEGVSKVEKKSLLLSNISLSNHITNVDRNFEYF